MRLEVEDIISPIAEERTPTDFLPGCDDFFFSNCDTIAISTAIDALSRQHLWPLSGALGKLGIARFRQQLEMCNFGLLSRMPQFKKYSKYPEDDISSKMTKIKHQAMAKFGGSLS